MFNLLLRWGGGAADSSEKRSEARILQKGLFIAAVGSAIAGVALMVMGRPMGVVLGSSYFLSGFALIFVAVNLEVLRSVAEVHQTKKAVIADLKKASEEGRGFSSEKLPEAIQQVKQVVYDNQIWVSFGALILSQGIFLVNFIFSLIGLALMPVVGVAVLIAGMVFISAHIIFKLNRVQEKTKEKGAALKRVAALEGRLHDSAKENQGTEPRKRSEMRSNYLGMDDLKTQIDEVQASLNLVGVELSPITYPGEIGFNKAPGLRISINSQPSISIEGLANNFGGVMHLFPNPARNGFYVGWRDKEFKQHYLLISADGQVFEVDQATFDKALSEYNAIISKTQPNVKSILGNWEIGSLIDNIDEVMTRSANLNIRDRRFLEGVKAKLKMVKDDATSELRIDFDRLIRINPWILTENDVGLVIAQAIAESLKTSTAKKANSSSLEYVKNLLVQNTKGTNSFKQIFLRDQIQFKQGMNSSSLRQVVQAVSSDQSAVTDFDQIRSQVSNILSNHFSEPQLFMDTFEKEWNMTTAATNRLQTVFNRLIAWTEATQVAPDDVVSDVSWTTYLKDIRDKGVTTIRVLGREIPLSEVSFAVDFPFNLPKSISESKGQGSEPDELMPQVTRAVVHNLDTLFDLLGAGDGEHGLRSSHKVSILIPKNLFKPTPFEESIRDILLDLDDDQADAFLGQLFISSLQRAFKRNIPKGLGILEIRQRETDVGRVMNQLQTQGLTLNNYNELSLVNDGEVSFYRLRDDGAFIDPAIIARRLMEHKNSYFVLFDTESSLFSQAVMSVGDPEDKHGLVWLHIQERYSGKIQRALEGGDSNILIPPENFLSSPFYLAGNERYELGPQGTVLNVHPDSQKRGGGPSGQNQEFTLSRKELLALAMMRLLSAVNGVKMDETVPLDYPNIRGNENWDFATTQFNETLDPEGLPKLNSLSVGQLSKFGKALKETQFPPTVISYRILFSRLKDLSGLGPKIKVSEAGQSQPDKSEEEELRENLFKAVLMELMRVISDSNFNGDRVSAAMIIYEFLGQRRSIESFQSTLNYRNPIGLGEAAMFLAQQKGGESEISQVLIALMSSAYQFDVIADFLEAIQMRYKKTQNEGEREFLADQVEKFIKSYSALGGSTFDGIFTSDEGAKIISDSYGNLFSDEVWRRRMMPDHEREWILTTTDYEQYDLFNAPGTAVSNLDGIKAMRQILVELGKKSQELERYEDLARFRRSLMLISEPTLDQIEKAYSFLRSEARHLYLNVEEIETQARGVANALGSGISIEIIPGDLAVKKPAGLIVRFNDGDELKFEGGGWNSSGIVSLFPNPDKSGFYIHYVKPQLNGRQQKEVFELINSRGAVFEIDKPRFKTAQKLNQLLVSGVASEISAPPPETSSQALKENGFKELGVTENAPGKRNGEGYYYKYREFLVIVNRGIRGEPVKEILTSVVYDFQRNDIVAIEPASKDGVQFFKIVYGRGSPDWYRASGTAPEQPPAISDDVAKKFPIKTKLIQSGFTEVFPGVYESISKKKLRTVVIYEDEKIRFVGNTMSSVQRDKDDGTLKRVYRKGARVIGLARIKEDTIPDSDYLDAIMLQSGPETYFVDSRGNYHFLELDTSVEVELPLDSHQFYTQSPSKPGGFVIGGKNSNEVIGNLKELTRVSIEEIEKRARPRAHSKAGMLGLNESFIASLLAENDFVTSRELTHQKLAEPLFYAMNLIKKLELRTNRVTGDNVTFRYRGRLYNASSDGWMGAQGSIFNDKLATVRDFKVTDIATGNSVSFSGLVPYYIWRYGFYEGKEVSYYVDPAKILAVFPQLLPSSEIAGGADSTPQKKSRSEERAAAVAEKVKATSPEQQGPVALRVAEIISDWMGGVLPESLKSFSASLFVGTKQLLANLDAASISNHPEVRQLRRVMNVALKAKGMAQLKQPMSFNAEVSAESFNDEKVHSLVLAVSALILDTGKATLAIEEKLLESAQEQFEAAANVMGLGAIIERVTLVGPEKQIEAFKDNQLRGSFTFMADETDLAQFKNIRIQNDADAGLNMAEALLLSALYAQNPDKGIIFKKFSQIADQFGALKDILEKALAASAAAVSA